MANETKTDVEVSENVSGPVITTERKSTEVLDNNGKSLSETNSPLSKIFDEVASGKDVGEAVDTVMKKASPPAKAKPLFQEQEKKEVKQDEPVVEKKEIVIEKPKTEAETKKEDAPSSQEEDVTEDELKVLPHDKPKTAKRISTLLKKLSDAESSIATTKKEAEEKAAKTLELQKELEKATAADPFSNEQVKKHMDELAMYRRRYELETSPEVKQKFDDRVVGAEETIQKNLVQRGLPETLLNEIKNEGGWLKFTDSQRTISLANGKEMTAAEIAEAIKSTLPLSARRQLEALELEQIQIQRDKQVYFQEETKKANEYFAQQANQTKAQQEAQKKAFDEATKVVNEWKKKFSEENEWLKEKEVGASLTPEQKAALEDHNIHAKQLNKLIDKHLAAKDINEMLEVLVDSIKYHQERRNLAFQIEENKKLKEQLAAKDAEISKFRRTSSAVPKSGSLQAAASIAAQEADKQKPMSLEDAFDAIAAGKEVE